MGGGAGGLHNRSLVGLVSLYALTVRTTSARVCVCVHALVRVLSWDFPLPSAEWLILPGYRMKTSSRAKKGKQPRGKTSARRKVKKKKRRPSFFQPKQLRNTEKASTCTIRARLVAPPFLNPEQSHRAPRPPSAASSPERTPTPPIAHQCAQHAPATAELLGSNAAK